jgi:hypothetical protein
MRLLRHDYVRVGKSFPEGLDEESDIFYVANRDNDTGLDIWWWGEEEQGRDQYGDVDLGVPEDPGAWREG